MNTRVLWNIAMRGADILSNYPNEVYQLPERSGWKTRTNYIKLPEDCHFRRKMVLRSGHSPTSFGSFTHFVRVSYPPRSGQPCTSFGSVTPFVRGLFYLITRVWNRSQGRFALFYRGFTFISFPLVMYLLITPAASSSSTLIILPEQFKV